MIIQQTLEHRDFTAESSYLQETIAALESALASGDPSGKIAEAIRCLRARQDELAPRIARYDQRLHG